MKTPPLKVFSGVLLVAYLLVLVWMVVFKLSLDLRGVLEYGQRSVGLVPFAGFSRGNVREMIDNFVIFLPFGLLLGVNFKRSGFWLKAGLVAAFSLVVETLQYALAIGVADSTDLILNTLGGFSGLALYEAACKRIDSKVLDRVIVAVAGVLLVALVLYRLLFLKVRY